MSGVDEDDKPTVILDLNALKKEKLKKEEDLANMASDLEFIAPVTEHQVEEVSLPVMAQATEISLQPMMPDSEFFAEEFLIERSKAEPTQVPLEVKKFPVILFDLNSDFFEKSLPQFPKGFEYKVVKTLNDLNQCLKSKDFQIVAFNYDGNPKAVNQLCAQIKTKKPMTKTIIMARAISPAKAQAHAKTASGAAGYYQYPLEQTKIEKEFEKIHQRVKKAS